MRIKKILNETVTLLISQNTNSISILLVEDNPADARLILEFFKDINIKNSIHIVHDGMEARNFLFKQCKSDMDNPDLIILDLNLPRISGREILKEIKEDKELKTIPVLILTTSEASEDIKECYDHYANCYLIKPVDFDEFTKIMESIKNFWFNKVELPPQTMN